MRDPFPIDPIGSQLSTPSSFLRIKIAGKMGSYRSDFLKYCHFCPTQVSWRRKWRRRATHSPRICGRSDEPSKWCPPPPYFRGTKCESSIIRDSTTCEGAHLCSQPPRFPRPLHATLWTNEVASEGSDSVTRLARRCKTAKPLKDEQTDPVESVVQLLHDDPVEREEAHKVDLQDRLKSAAASRRPFAREAAK